MPPTPGLSARYWTPLDDPSSLATWLDALDRSTLYDGVGLSAGARLWEDKAPGRPGRMYHIPAGLPILGSRTSPNGRYVIEGVAASQTQFSQFGVAGVQMTLAQPFVVFVACATDTNAATESIFDGVGNRTSCGRAFGSAVWSMNAGSSINGSASDTNPHVHAFTFNGTASSIRTDGITTVTGNAGTNSINGGINVGSRSSGGGNNNWWDGWWGDVIIVKGVPTPARYALYERFLSAKFGIPLSYGGVSSPPLIAGARHLWLPPVGAAAAATYMPQAVMVM